MKLYVFLFFVLTCLSPIAVFAQNQIVYYLKNDGKQVSTKDSADYIRIVSDADSDTGFYNISEYYKNEKLKLTGKTSKTDGSFLQDQCIAFYPDGKRRWMGVYKNNDRVGDFYFYYPNGKLYAIKKYAYRSYQIIACNDSIGKVLASEKNGYFIDFDDEFKQIKEEGNVTNGLKNGEWHGNFILNSAKVTYSETYEMGQLVSGHSLKDGQDYQYLTHDEGPQYKGGVDGLRRFLDSHLKYPNYERVNKIYSGGAYIEFTVKTDGSATNFKVLSTESKGFGEEGIRVLKQIKWIPGRYYGFPAAMQTEMPINFSLQVIQGFPSLSDPKRYRLDDSPHQY